MFRNVRLASNAHHLKKGKQQRKNGNARAGGGRRPEG